MGSEVGNGSADSSPSSASSPASATRTWTDVVFVLGLIASATVLTALGKLSPQWMGGLLISLAAPVNAKGVALRLLGRADK